MANCIKCGRSLPPLSFGKRICKWCAEYEAAQRGEVREDARQRVEAPPWVRRNTAPMVLTQVLLGINVAVFLGMTLAGISLTNPTSQQLVHWGANWGPLTLGGQSWRLLTCMFLHIGIIHIGFNMWCLWDLGALAESLYGHWTFAAVYLISGLGGSVASVAWRPGGISAGASGAIFGIAGALIASFYLGEFSLPRAAVQGSLRSVVTFAGYNLVFGAISGRTDNAAHIGGLVTGLILGALIARMAPVGNPIRRMLIFALVLVPVLGSAAWLQRSRTYLLHAQRGSALLEENKTDQAIVELEAAVSRRPDFAPAHFALARAYFQTAQLAKAETELKRVLELKPNDESAYFALGFIYLQQNRPRQARDAFGQLLAIDKTSAKAHLGLGMAAAAEADYQAALQAYKTAAGLEPELNGVYYQMGLAYAKLKMYDEAIAAYVKEQQTDGEDYDTQVALAGAYQAKGMQQEAEEAMHKAAQLKAGH
jgi:rhomboid protease GluP